MNSSVIILSGGLDSSVLLYSLLDRGQRVSALSFNYGQKHARELLSAQIVASGATHPGLRDEVSHRVVDLSSIQPLISNSSQTSSEIEVPHGHYQDENMKLTVVPNRNMIMLSIAIGYAINIKADFVAYGAHAGDHPIYPDCRPEFIEALSHAAVLADWHKVGILRPFIGLTKAEIVSLGASLGVPFEETWSCYEGGEIHCGRCGTCVERREAFELARVSDPTQYAI
jgi:7-cyano-7-deazaguanine synthase